MERKKNDQLFKDVKRPVTSTPILVYYDPDENLIIQRDSSRQRVRAALLIGD